jgi:hypothetical protein
MMGLGGTVSFTPNKSGVLVVAFSGSIANSTASDGAQTGIRYGTGTAPTNGAALTGTAAGAKPKVVNNASTAALKVPFSITVVITGLTFGAAYWFDLSLARISGGTATVTDITAAIFEV